MARAYRAVLACQSAEDEYADNLAAGCLLAYARSRPELRGRARVTLERYALRGGPGPAELASRIAAAAPGLAGFSCYVWNRAFVLEAMRRLKAASPATVIVVGGPEAAGAPADFLDGAADLVVRGEGEAAFAAIIARLAAGRDPRAVEGTSFLREGALVHHGRPMMLERLDAIPCPYQAGVFRYGPDFDGVVTIEISRGCPFECSYCTWSQRRRIAYFPVERVLRTVRSILARAPRARFCFADSNILFDGERARALFAGLRKIGASRPDARWNFEMDVRSIGRVDPEALRLVDSSQFVFGIGVQSFNPRALRLARRPGGVDALERSILRLRREAPRACLVVELICGLPGDTLADYRHTLERALLLPFDAFNFMPLIVQEGSRYRRDAAALGLVFDPKPPHFLRSAPGFPAEDLEAARRLSFTVRFFMDRAPVRRALQAARRARPSAGSLVDLCEALDRRLESSGAFSLSRAYARFDWGVIHQDDGLAGTTKEERCAVLREVYACLKEAAGRAGQEANA